MTGKITHKGVVEDTGDGWVKVRILQTSACSACKVAGHCSAAESKEKTVQVSSSKAGRYQPGEEVVVAMTAGNGRDAVILAFILPFVIMVAVLMLCLWLTGNEGIAALAGIASLVPYYAVVYHCKDKLARRFAFVIEE